MDENPWLSTANAARLLGVSPSTLNRWADAGEIAHIKTRSGHRRFLKSDLEAYLEDHTFGRTTGTDKVSGAGAGS